MINEYVNGEVVRSKDPNKLNGWFRAYNSYSEPTYFGVYDPDLTWQKTVETNQIDIGTSTLEVRVGYTTVVDKATRKIIVAGINVHFRKNSAENYVVAFSAIGTNISLANSTSVESYEWFDTYFFDMVVDVSNAPTAIAMPLCYCADGIVSLGCQLGSYGSPIQTATVYHTAKSKTGPLDGLNINILNTAFQKFIQWTDASDFEEMRVSLSADLDQYVTESEIGSKYVKL